MPSRLTRYQKDGHYHAINFTCYRQQPWLEDDHACIVFEETLEELRRRHDFYLFGYVVMPTHVHLLMSEPKQHTLATTISVLKGETSKHLKGDRKQFWQIRYYDFNVFTHAKFTEKLRYIHRNPVVDGGWATHKSGWPIHARRFTSAWVGSHDRPHHHDPTESHPNTNLRATPPIAPEAAR